MVPLLGQGGRGDGLPHLWKLVFRYSTCLRTPTPFVTVGFTQRSLCWMGLCAQVRSLKACLGSCRLWGQLPGL